MRRAGYQELYVEDHATHRHLVVYALQAVAQTETVERLGVLLVIYMRADYIQPLIRLQRELREVYAQSHLLVQTDDRRGQLGYGLVGVYELLND